MKKVHKVGLEFLRHGPAHNQLLSPLTQYLGLCGNFGACTVQVTYEHQKFLSRLKSLRYNIGGADDAERRQQDLNETSDNITDILASVPGLKTSLGSGGSRSVSITHLDLVLSAAELAMLPFELAKVPPGCAGGEGNYLLLQTLLPVCLTRRVRSISSTMIFWPKRPKILFIVAQLPHMNVPALDHTKALLKAIDPWIPYFDPFLPGDREKKIGEILTILPEASIKDIEDACATNAYTHVHILAHGMESKNKLGTPYGLVLHDPQDKNKINVVDGEQLASALRPLRQQTSTEPDVTLPAIVTVAACDSGTVSSVIYSNGTSLAHELHQAGIPVVVASQFPLSKAASVHVAEVLYQRMLWGEDIRIIQHSLRSKLHALCPDTHDWASLVMYANLPPDLDQQLLDMRYAQAKRAIDCALERIDKSIDREIPLDEAEMKRLLERVDAAAGQMPTTEGYETEGRGMLASTEKRKAEMCFRAILKFASKESKQEELKKRSIEYLRKSLRLYEQAYRENMQEAAGIIRKNRSVHWVMTQYLSLRAVLGEPFLPDHWSAAMVSAEVDVRSHEGSVETVVWAHGSMFELYLMLLAYDPSDVKKKVELSQKEVREKAQRHIGELLSIAGNISFPYDPVYATVRQLDRYISWWGHDTFESLLTEHNLTRKRPWCETGGIVELARELKTLLGK
ncbi:MAG: CHAT domain-containing protein [Syntrophaceae bacterium]